jgi:predicted transcriptional regulator
VSTVQEIQEAIKRLPELQQMELENWLYSHLGVGSDDEAALLAEAEEGERQIREGKFVTIEEARKLTRTWITK